MLNIASRKAFGIGTNKEIEVALNIFEKVLLINHQHYHKQNNPKYHIEIIKGQAYFYLGYIYYHGCEVPVNIAKAKEYFELGKLLQNENCLKIKI